MVEKLEAISTLVRVGAVVSTTTLLVSVTLVTVAAAFPARSLKSMSKLTRPSVSAASTV